MLVKNKLIILNYILSALFFFLFVVTSKSIDYASLIESIVPSEKRIVNYGPCFLNDTLYIKFFVKNSGEKPLLMNPLKPTFYLGLSPNDPTANQFNLFRRNTTNPVLPKIFESGDSDTLRISFIAGDTTISNTGWHEALLGLSFLKSNAPDDGPISKIDTFFLRVKKTPYFVAGFEDAICFDTVYVYPNINIDKNWRVKNVWNKNQFLIGFEKKLITQSAEEEEIIISKFPINNEISPQNIFFFPIRYYPKNRGNDSLLLKLNYRPLPNEFPDSIDYAWTMVSGYGAEQDIRIKSSNYNWYNDTIDLGDIFIDNNINIDIKIENKSNFPFGILSQKILNIDNNSTNENFVIKQLFVSNGKHIPINDESTCQISFSPNKPGKYIARLQIESDILKRNFLGTQPEKQYIQFYIKANVKSPILLSSANEIDFGNIIVNNSNCLSNIDTTIKIYNTGNSDLIIRNILFNPKFPEGNFFSNDFQTIIPAGESSFINISFQGNSGEYKSYSAKLLLVNNQLAPNDIVEINLSAKSVPPITAYLSMPQDLKSKPGTNIEVPIVLNSNDMSPAQYAKSFTTSLYYNRNLLEYNGIRTINTACEGAFNIGENFENPQKNELFLEIVTAEQSYFKKKDTLFFIKFKSYLGDAPATEISFVNPKFSDGKCNDIFTLINQNGIYTTDSICGLDYKAVPLLSGKFNLNLFYKNDFYPYQIDFELPYNTYVNISISDILGNIVENIISENLVSGNYKMNFSFDILPFGTYFIMLKTPQYTIVKPFSIIK